MVAFFFGTFPLHIVRTWSFCHIKGFVMRILTNHTHTLEGNVTQQIKNIWPNILKQCHKIFQFQLQVKLLENSLHLKGELLPNISKITKIDAKSNTSYKMASFFLLINLMIFFIKLCILSADHIAYSMASKSLCLRTPLVPFRSYNLLILNAMILNF